jgi:K+-sensing histidine kinase KdpD
MLDQAKGNLRIFYADPPRIGVVIAMLRAARTVRRDGEDIVIGHLPLLPASPRALKRIRALQESIESLPLEPAVPDQTAPDFDISAALQRRPRIIVTGKLLTPHAARDRDVTLDSWYERIEQLLAAGINVWTAIYATRPARRFRRAR